jgi:uncharacterized membrane protein (TIGR02234 family)
MRSRLLIVAALVVAGALVVLLASSQTWGSLTVANGPGVAHQHVTVDGRQVSPALSALAVALIALAVAAVAARGLLRRLLAALGVAVAVIEIVVAVHADVGNALAARVFGVHELRLPAHEGSWWMLAAAGGVVAALSFGVIAIAGGRWPGMGARYDAPQSAARQKDPAVAAWEALDRGDDPTA